MTHRLFFLLFAFSIAGAFDSPSGIDCKLYDGKETMELQRRRCQEQYLLNANFVTDMMKLMNNYNYTESSDKALQHIPINVTIQPQLGVNSVKFNGFQEFKEWLQHFRVENNVDFFTPSNPRDLQTNDYQGISSKWTAASKLGKLEGFFIFINDKKGKLSELEIEVNKNNYGDVESIRKNFYKCSTFFASRCNGWITRIEEIVHQFNHFDEFKDELIQKLNWTTFYFSPISDGIGIDEVIKSEKVKLFENMALLKPEINYGNILMKWPVFMRVGDKDVFGHLQAEFYNRMDETQPSYMRLSTQEDPIYVYY